MSNYQYQGPPPQEPQYQYVPPSPEKPWYKKTWAIVVGGILAALIFLSILGSLLPDTEPRPPVPVPAVTQTVQPRPTPIITTAPPTSQAPVGKEAIFLKVVRDEYPALNKMPDDVIVNLAKSSCRALDNGATKEDVVAMLQKNASSQEILNMMAFVVGAGVPAFCPQNIDKVR